MTRFNAFFQHTIVGVWSGFYTKLGGKSNKIPQIMLLTNVDYSMKIFFCNTQNVTLGWCLMPQMYGGIESKLGTRCLASDMVFGLLFDIYCGVLPKALKFYVTQNLPQPGGQSKIQ